MTKFFAISASMGVVVVLCAGCGRAPNRAEQANDVYRQAIMGDQSQAIALLTQSIDIKPEAFMYLKRAELFLKIGDDVAAKADIDMAQHLGAQESDCRWLLDEAARPANRRFQGEAAAAPSLDK